MLPLVKYGIDGHDYLEIVNKASTTGCLTETLPDTSNGTEQIYRI